MEADAVHARRLPRRVPDAPAEILAAQRRAFGHHEREAVGSRLAVAGDVLDHDLHEERRRRDGSHAGGCLRRREAEALVDLEQLLGDTDLLVEWIEVLLTQAAELAPPEVAVRGHQGQRLPPRLDERRKQRHLLRCRRVHIRQPLGRRTPHPAR